MNMIYHQIGCKACGNVLWETNDITLSYILESEVRCYRCRKFPLETYTTSGYYEFDGMWYNPLTWFKRKFVELNKKEN